MSNVYLINNNLQEIYHSDINEIFNKDEQRYHKQLRPDTGIDYVLAKEIDNKKNTNSDVSKICHRLCHDLIMYWKERIKSDTDSNYLVYVDSNKTILFGKNKEETDYLSLDGQNLNLGKYNSNNFKNLEKEIKKILG